MKKLLLISSSLLLLTGCSKEFKKTIGLTTTPPDEYQAKRNPALEIPPHYNIKATKDNKSYHSGGSKKGLSKSEKALLEDIEN